MNINHCVIKTLVIVAFPAISACHGPCGGNTANEDTNQRIIKDTNRNIIKDDNHRIRFELLFSLQGMTSKDKVVVTRSSYSIILGWLLDYNGLSKYERAMIVDIASKFGGDNFQCARFLCLDLRR